MALFVVLSVFSGLRDFSLSFSNDFDADLKVIPHVGKSFFISSKQENQLKNLKDIASFSKVVEERVLFFFDGKEQVTYLKGVDANFTRKIMMMLIKTNKVEIMIMMMKVPK